MSQARPQPVDPIAWCWAITAGFIALASIRLTIPSAAYFDEIHYLPAARELLSLGEYTNREHPLFGKQLIALGIALFGDNALGWRIAPLAAGGLALFAGMRALWYATLDRAATMFFGLLLASGFHLFVQSRIAMLDIFYLAFLAAAFWQCAAAMREPETGRRRLALAGVFLGLAMASKWNALPLAIVPGIVFVVMRWQAGRRRILLSRRGAPVPGMTLLEASVWLGLLPLAIYFATFLPAYHFETNAIGAPGGPASLLSLQHDMATLHSSVVQPHPYQSTWPQWMLNAGAIWYLYEFADGAQRGVMLIGNPLSMILGLMALLWCALRAIVQREAVPGAIVGLYVLSLCFWMIADKPIQFYYHYALPSMFMLAALALALGRLWDARRYWVIALAIGGSLALFAFFYPILSAAPLENEEAFRQYTWLESWR